MAQSNQQFINQLSAKIEQSLIGTGEQLITIDEINRTIRVLQISIKTSKGLLRYEGQLVSIDRMVFNTLLEVNIYNNDLFKPAKDIINRNRVELMDRGFAELKELNLWITRRTTPAIIFDLKLTSFKVVREAIIKEIKKDEALKIYIDSNERLLSY